MLINKLLNKEKYIVPESARLIILDIKYYVCMPKNGKDTKHTRHSARRVNCFRNGENCKIHNIVWC